MVNSKKSTNIDISNKSWNSELELVQAAASKDKKARNDLVELLMDRVLRLSTCLAGNAWESEDLAQTALIEIIRSAKNFRGDSSLARWADRITVFTALKKIERHKRRERLFALRPEMQDNQQLPDEKADSLRVQRRFAMIAGTLSPTRRVVVVLHHVHGYSIAEIAEMTNSPANTVHDRLKVGRKQLRKKILADPLLREWVKMRKK